MTAINVFQQSDAVHVVVDGLIGRPFLASKIYTIPHLSCAISITGGDKSFSMLARLGWEASFQYSAPEYVILNLAELVRRCQEKYGEDVPQPSEPMNDAATDHFVVVVAAYISRPFKIGSFTVRPGPFVALLGSHNIEVFPAYSLLWRTQQPEAWLIPDVDPIVREFSDYLGGRDMDAIDIDNAAAAIIEIQRRRVNPEFPNTLGGHALVTSIMRCMRAFFVGSRGMTCSAVGNNTEVWIAGNFPAEMYQAPMVAVKASAQPAVLAANTGTVYTAVASAISNTSITNKSFHGKLNGFSFADGVGGAAALIVTSDGSLLFDADILN